MTVKSVEGIYRNGQIELLETPEDISGEIRVIVTFLGIETEDQAISLRARLKSFAEDWDSPEMDIYNDYDNAKANL